MSRKMDVLRDSLTIAFLNNTNLVVHRPRITEETVLKGQECSIEYIEHLSRMTKQDLQKLYQGVWSQDDK